MSPLASNAPRFRSTPEFAGETLTLRLEGEADLDASDELGRVVDSIHDEAVRAGAREVVADITQLEFLSSSGLCHFVSWLRKASEGASYKIRIRSSPVIFWQKRSLAALGHFAPGILTIEVSKN